MRLIGLGTPGHWTLQETVEVMRNIGTDRIVYGTNYPTLGTVAFCRNLPRIAVDIKRTRENSL